jgi:predicted RNA-binding protein YlxR (DUF448 family)
VVCRTSREDTLLVRAGRRDDGAWYLGRGPGRGVWWCAQGSCAQRVSEGAIARALRAPVSRAEAEALRALAVGPERR